MHVLVLGGTGLIGSAIVRKLLAEGHDVTGLGRQVTRARRQSGDARWLIADIATLQSPAAWMPFIDGSDVIVNAAGALQTGMRDDLAALQTAFVALYDAAALQKMRVIVISAPNASPDATTEFSRSKALADAHLRGTTLDWTILRPGLIIGSDAYGGTALVRAIAASPFVVPIVRGTLPIQTVALIDLAAAVAAVVAGRIAPRGDYDLVETEPRLLSEIASALRAWFGIAPAPVWPVPDWLTEPLFELADLLGWLGWRSPLRSTAVAELKAGVAGDSRAWVAAGGRQPQSLTATLADLHATVQERWFARLWLLKPVILGTLSLFWLTTGFIALARPFATTAVLAAHGVATPVAFGLGIAGGILDVALGTAMLVARSARTAALGMIVASITYIAAGTLLAPDLWLDPLGPLVKIAPGIVLALVALALLDER
jgi:uncharacterized protein YbjT (DUF2867 family)